MRTHPPVRATYSLGDPAGSLSKGTGSAGGYAVQPCLCKRFVCIRQKAPAGGRAADPRAREAEAECAGRTSQALDSKGFGGSPYGAARRVEHRDSRTEDRYETLRPWGRGVFASQSRRLRLRSSALRLRRSHPLS